MVALPTAESDAAFTFVINAVGKPQLQNSFLRLVGSFDHAQRKRVEIEKGVSIPLEADGGNVAIQHYHVTAPIFGGVFPNQGEEVFPMGIVAIIFIHDFDLPEMYSFKSDVYVGSSLIIKPKLGFDPALVRDLGVWTHGAALFRRGINHIRINKISFLDRL